MKKSPTLILYPALANQSFVFLLAWYPGSQLSGRSKKSKGETQTQRNSVMKRFLWYPMS